MKRMLSFCIGLISLFVAASTVHAASFSVVSDNTVDIVGVYNKAGGSSNFVDLSVSPIKAVRAQEPKPYPNGYVSEGPEVTNSVWDTGVEWSFQTNAPGSDWIWETERAEGPASLDPSDPRYDADASSNGRVVVFQKEFDIVGIPQNSNLRITADNGWEVWVNGNYVARSATAKTAGWELSALYESSLGSSGWQTVGNITIPASVLLTGKNTLKILAGNEYYHPSNPNFEANNSPVPAYVSNPYTQRNPGGLIFSLNVAYEVSPLVVTKTVETSFSRTWNWTIEKTVSPETMTLAAGQQANANYTVAVTADPTDSDWAVSGTITIQNPNTVPAEISNVADILGEVTCPEEFSDLAGTLAAGATLVCTYSGTGLSGEETVNSAVVSTTGAVPGASDEEQVVFGGTPTAELDECVDVSDSIQGILGTNICATDQNFNYTRTIGPYAYPGVFIVDNTASLVTNDSNTEKEVTARVTITAPVAGCTLTQGYWKTHSSEGKAPYDDSWQLIGALEEDTSFFISGQTYYQVLWTAPKKGNAYYQLAHQYIAAELNKLNGASTTQAVVNALAQAKTLFTTYTPAQIEALKGSDTTRKLFVSLAGTLGSYNEGQIGPGHCDEQGMLTGTWLLSVNGGSYLHDMYILTQNPDGTLMGTGGYQAGSGPVYPYPYNWSLTGNLTGNSINMSITYQNGYNAILTGTVNSMFNFMSGGAGTGGVVNWSATRI